MPNERYEDITGPPGAVVWSRWLTSADFPAYGKDITLTIDKCQKGTDLDVGGGQPRKDGIVAIFCPTGAGRGAKQLLLNKGHQKALGQLFGKLVETWIGLVNVYCQKGAYKIGGELVDGVKIRTQKPKANAGAPLNNQPNPGGGPGKLGTPPPSGESPAERDFRILGEEARGE